MTVLSKFITKGDYTTAQKSTDTRGLAMQAFNEAKQMFRTNSRLEYIADSFTFQFTFTIANAPEEDDLVTRNVASNTVYVYVTIDNEDEKIDQKLQKIYEYCKILFVFNNKTIIQMYSESEGDDD